MGVRSEDNKCVLNLLENAFSPALSDKEKTDCQEKDGNYIIIGHIPRNMRVSLNLIDLAAPYIIVKESETPSNKIKLNNKKLRMGTDL